MSLLDVQNLHVAFARADARGNAQNGNGVSAPVGLSAARGTAVRDVSFRVEKGQCVALVGESGAGKTLTSRSIVRLLPGGAHVTQGRILFKGEDVLSLPDKAVMALRGRKIGMVFQDPLAALNPLHRVGDQVAECLRAHESLSEEQVRSRVLDLFDLVRLDHAAERYRAYPHQLSGGQRQRIMLALAVANKPDLLIADEPTTALDATVQQVILELLHDMRAEFGMGLLLVSHDLGMVRRFADTVHVMRHGEIVESSSSLFADPQHEYTRALLHTGFDPADQVIQLITLGLEPLRIVVGGGITFAAITQNRHDRSALAARAGRMAGGRRDAGVGCRRAHPRRRADRPGRGRGAVRRPHRNGP